MKHPSKAFVKDVITHRIGDAQGWFVHGFDYTSQEVWPFRVNFKGEP
jgi:hypothetical protein